MHPHSHTVNSPGYHSLLTPKVQRIFDFQYDVQKEKLKTAPFFWIKLSGAKFFNWWKTFSAIECH